MSIPAVLEADPQYRRRANAALAALCAAVFVAALDQTMVLTVMPSIMNTLHIPYTRINDAGWIVTGYLLGYTVAMPLFGRLADVRGRRPMYIVALALFLLGSGFCVLAPNLGWFVVARVIQASGGGALVPIAMAAGADMYPARRRALILGIIGAAAEAGGVLGPIYGAGLTKLWEWQLIFLVNIPLSLLLIALAWRLILSRPRYVEGADEAYPATVAEAAAASTAAGALEAPARRPSRPARFLRNRRTSEPPPAGFTSHPSGSPRLHVPHFVRRLGTGQVDYVGAVFMALALAGVTIGVGSSTSTEASAAPVRWQWLIVAAVAFVIFLLYERRLERPLVRLDFFRHAPFAGANIANFLVGGALIIALVEVPLYSYSLLGYSEIQGGLLLVRFTLMIPVGAVVGGWVADRIGYRVTALAGFAIGLAGFILLSLWPAHPSVLQMTRDLMITGLGFGLVIAPISATVIASVGPKWMATGSALVTVTRMIGMVVGISALGSWGVSRFNGLMAGYSLPLRGPGMTDAQYQALQDAYQVALDHAFRTVYHDFFLIAAVITGLALIPSFFFLRRHLRNRDAGQRSRIPFLPS